MSYEDIKKQLDSIAWNTKASTKSTTRAGTSGNTTGYDKVRVQLDMIAEENEPTKVLPGFVPMTETTYKAKRDTMLRDYKKASYDALMYQQAVAAGGLGDPAAADAAERARRLKEEIERLDIQSGKGPRDLDLADRAATIFSGGTKQSASGYLNFMGTGLDLMKESSIRLGGDISPYAGYATDEVSAGQIGRQQAQKEDFSDVQQFVDKLQSYADSLGESASQDFARAKNGLGKLGQAGVDIAANVLQMGYDAALGGLGSMFARSAGSAAQEARQQGADVFRQAAYGAASGGVEVLTEKMFDGVAKIYGAGAADEAVEEAIRKLTKSDFGRTALRWFSGAAGEGIEEVVSDLVAPYAETLYNGKSVADVAKGTFTGDTYNLSEILYDFIIGAAIGGLGGATSVTTGQNAQANRELLERDAGLGDVTSQANDAWEVLTGRRTAAQQAERERAARERLGITEADVAARNAETQAENLTAELTEEQKKQNRTETMRGILSRSSEAAGVQMTDEEATAIAEGYEAGTNGRLYAAAATDAYKLGKSGQYTLEEAMKASHYTARLSAEQFRNAFEAGAGAAETNAVDTSTEEGRQTLTAALSSLGEHAEDAASAYEAGQDVSRFAAGMSEAAERYAVTGADIRAQDGGVPAESVISTLTDAQIEKAQEIGGRLRETRAAAVSQLAEQRKAIRAQAQAIEQQGAADTAALTEVNRQIREANKLGRETVEMFEAQRDALTKAVEADPNFQNTEEYAKAFDEAKANMEKAQDLQRAVEDLNAKKKALEGKAPAKRKKGTVSLDGGNIAGTDYAGIDRSKLTRQQQNIVAMVERLADFINIDYVVFDGPANMGGAYLSGGRVFININAGMTQAGRKSIAAASLSHELTHFMQDYAPEEYLQLKDYVIGSVLKKSSAEFDRLVEQQRRWEPGKSYDELVDELVANACQTMLTDDKAVQRMARSNMTLAQKVADVLDEIGEKIRKAFEGLSFDEDRAIFAPVKAVMDEIDGITERWADGISAAVENYNAEQTVRQAEGNENTATEGGAVQYQFAGERAENADREALAHAIEMELDGAGNEELRQATGWFRGMDGKWRFEIQDYDARFSKNGDIRFAKDHPEYARYIELTNKFIDGTITAEEAEEAKRLARTWGPEQKRLSNMLRSGRTSLDMVLDHPALFEAYPDLRSVKVVYDDMGAGAKGSFDPKTNTISLSEDADSSTLFHEIQHAIQEIEGFSKGASIEYWQSAKRKGDLQAYPAELRTEVERIYSGIQQIENEAPGITRAAWLFSPEEMEHKFGRTKAKEITDLVNRRSAIYYEARGDYDLYANTAGEIEARDAAFRSSFVNERQYRGIKPNLGNGDTVFADDNRGNKVRNQTWDESEYEDLTQGLSEDDVYEVLHSKREELRFAQAKIKERRNEDVEQVKKVMNGDLSLDEYNSWREETGLAQLQNEADTLDKETRMLAKRYDELVDQRMESEEKESIEKSGLSEAEYFGKEAVKAFGYTPYYYDAGYIVPNGKMLNFSGEKGKHFGSRGEDHRAIGQIFATTKMSDAMIRFMSYGNIRIMAESPGLDISTTVKPTATQYSAIRSFVRSTSDEGYFAVDFTDENGRTIGTLEYDDAGRVNPARVVADIQRYFETGKVPEVGMRYQFQTWDDDYAQAVQNGDTETEKKLVAQAAKRAGYKYHGYHGTLATDFTEFKKEFVGTRFSFDEKGFFFIDRQSIAKDYATSEFDSSRKGRVIDAYLRIRKPLVVDKAFALKEGLGNIFRDDDVIDAWDNYSSYFIEEADNIRADGIIVDDGSTKMFVVFDGEQIKSADPVTYDDAGNVIPLSSRFNRRERDFRFQRFDDTTDDTAEERNGRELAYARLQSENAILRETVDELRKLSKKHGKTIEALQKKLSITKTPETRQSDARKLAKALVQEHGSKADVDALAEKLKALGDYILQTETDKLSEDEIKNRARSIARDIVESATEQISIGDDTFQRIAGEIKGRKLYIDEDFLGELDQTGGYDAFRKSVFGNFTLAKRESASRETRDGYMTVDQFYTDMQGEYGKGLFPDAANEGEQVQILSQMLDAAKPMAVNPFEQYMGEATEDMANQIVMDAMNGVLRQTAPTTADRQKARTQALKEQIDQLKAENKLEQREAASLYHTVYDLTVALDKAASKYQTLQAEADYRAAQLRAEGTARAAEIKAAERERAEEKIAQLKAHYQEMRESAKERREESAGVTKYRKQVEKKAKKLYEMLMTNSNDLHVPEVLKTPLGEFLESLDFSSKRRLAGGEDTVADANFGARLVRIQQMLDNQQRYIDGDGSVAQDLGGYIDVAQPILEHLRTMAELITTAMSTGRTFTVNQMTAADLKMLSDFLSNLRTAINNMNHFMANARYASVQTAAQADIERMKRLGKASETSASEAVRFAGWENGTPYYIMKRLGDGAKSIFDGFAKGWERLAFNAQEIIDFTEKLYTDKEVNAWKRDIHDITLSDGSKVKMTTAQIMELSMLLGREQAVKHISRGGIRIGDIKTKNGLIEGTRHDTKHYHLSDTDIKTITGMLTARQMEVAKKMQKFMAEKGAEWGNEVSMRRFGYKFYEEGPGYYPIKTDSNDRPMADTDAQTNSMFRLLNLSSSKALNPKASNALVVGDIFDTFADHMSDMAKLNGMGLPILDAIKWFNYKERVNHEDGTYDTVTLQGAMEEAFGEQAQRYFRTLMKDINGVNESGDRGTSLPTKMMSNYKIAAVAANLRVAFLQPTSYIRATTVLKPKYMANVLPSRAAYREAMQYSGTAVWKSLGYYETDISKSMRQQITHDDSFKDKVADKSMTLAELGDQATWSMLWQACKRQEKAESPALSHDALMEKTAALFREVVYSSQVMDSTLTRSEIMRGKTGWTKAMSAFMAEPTLSYNILMDAASELDLDVRENGKAGAWKRNAGKIGKAVSVYVASAAFSAVVESIADAIRDDDDEDFWEKFNQALWGEDRKWWTGNFVQDLTILGKLPYVKNFISKLQGYSSGDMSVAAFNNLVDVAAIWNETIKLAVGTQDKPTKVTYFGKMTQWGKVYKTLQALSQLSGFAVYNLTRDATAIWNTAMDVAGKQEWKIRTYEQSSTELAKSLIRALDGGESDEIAKRTGAFDSEKAALAAVKEQLKDDFGNGTRDRESVEKLLEKAGMDEDDIWFTIHGWETGDGSAVYNAAKRVAFTGDRSAYKAEVAGLTEHGKTEKSVQSAVKELCKDVYFGNELSEKEQEIIGDRTFSNRELRSILMDYCGMDLDTANETLAQWQKDKRFQDKYGFSWSERKDQFYSGAISRKEALRIIMDYDGVTEEEAEEKVEVWEWSRDVRGAEEITLSAVQKYNEFCEAAGVSKADYVTAWSTYNKTEPDKAENGETIRNSKMFKYFDYLGGLPLTADEKTAIALTFYSAKNVKKYKTW